MTVPVGALATVEATVGARGLVHAVAADQPGAGLNLEALGLWICVVAARDVPDPRLVDVALEEARGRRRCW